MNRGTPYPSPSSAAFMTETLPHFKGQPFSYRIGVSEKLQASQLRVIQSAAAFPGQQHAASIRLDDLFDYPGQITLCRINNQQTIEPNITRF